MRLLASLVLIASTAALAAPSASIFGDWTTPTGSVVRVVRCGGDACLTVVRISPKAPETKDKKNPNPSLRGRDLCGLIIGTSFHETDPEHFSGGQLYDPKDGHTYSGSITADGDTLRLHGYIGIAFFGRTEIWHRATAVTACK